MSVESLKIEPFPASLPHYERVKLPTEYHTDSFRLREQQFNHQFSCLYRLRLNKLKPILRDLVIKKWGESTRISSQLIDSEYFPDEVVEVVLIGNIFKELKLRPSVLTEYRLTGEIGEISETFENYHSETDKIFLEDESGRILLVGSEKFSHFVTGITLAIRGRVLADGQFQVSDWCHLYHSIPRELSSQQPTNDSETSNYILLASGFEFGSNVSMSTSEGISRTVPLEFSVQLLADFISGRLGGQEDTKLASQIVRVIIVGNSVAPIDSEIFKDRFLSATQQSLINSPMKQLDEFLSQILGSCPIDLIPGPTDPTNSSLPQQPFNPCLLPTAIRFNTFRATTNPFESTVTTQFDDTSVRLIGHSGEPVDDIRRQTRSGVDSQELRRPVEILSDTFRWGHFCPTAPDTISAFPYTSEDPFIILPPPSENSLPPTVFFAGNQEKFDWKLESISCSESSSWTVPLLSIAIPKFSVTRQVVLVNLQNFHCRTITFGI